MVHRRERPDIADPCVLLVRRLQLVLVAFAERVLHNGHQIAVAVHIRIPVDRDRFREIRRGHDPRHRALRHDAGPDHVVLMRIGVFGDDQDVLPGDERQVVRAGNAVHIAGVRLFRRALGILLGNPGHDALDLGADKVAVELHLIHRAAIVLRHADVVAADQIGLFVRVGHRLGNLRHCHINPVGRRVTGLTFHLAELGRGPLDRGIARGLQPRGQRVHALFQLQAFHIAIGVRPGENFRASAVRGKIGPLAHVRELHALVDRRPDGRVVGSIGHSGKKQGSQTHLALHSKGESLR